MTKYVGHVNVEACACGQGALVDSCGVLGVGVSLANTIQPRIGAKKNSCEFVCSRNSENILQFVWFTPVEMLMTSQ